MVAQAERRICMYSLVVVVCTGTPPLQHEDVIYKVRECWFSPTYLQQLLRARGEVVAAAVLEEAEGDVEVGERPVVLALHLRQADPRVRHVVLHGLGRDDAVQLVVNLKIREGG